LKPLMKTVRISLYYFNNFGPEAHFEKKKKKTACFLFWVVLYNNKNN